MEEGTKESCMCYKCKSACQNKPGWFMPGKAEHVASYLGISLEDLFKSKLIVDWWEDRPNIFLLSPGVINGRSGVEAQGDFCGTCVFFKNELCEIHSVKPFECKEGIHDRDREINRRIHKQIADSWRPHQDQIVTLLHHVPRSQNFSIFGSIFKILDKNIC